MPEYDHLLIQKAFFEKVLTISTDAQIYRFVAWADRLDGEYSNAKIRQVWNPANEPTRPFNLVLSLASNGKHYPLVDWDTPDNPRGKQGIGLISDSVTIWFRSGSGNWHGYINHFGGSHTTAVMVAEHPRKGEEPDQKTNEYATHVARAGFATLRPPWRPKGGRPDDLMEKFPDALPEGFLDGIDLTPTPICDAWEALFND